MPTRLIREGILSSDRVDQLDWPAEVFYRRLMSKVDDHGLYDARASILRSQLYPLKVDRVREADITRWIAMCEKAGLIVLYEAGGKPFLQMLDTKWEKRGKPKFPLPDENVRKHAETVVSKSTVVEGVVGVEVVGESPRKRDPHQKRNQKTQLPSGFAVSERVRAWAAGKGFDRLDLHLENFVSVCRAKGYTYVDWDEGFMRAIKDNWAKLSDKVSTHTTPERDLQCQQFIANGERCPNAAALWNVKGTKGNCQEHGPL